jgi:hypothetical protein
VDEAISKIESKVGDLTRDPSPSPPGDHPELDKSPPLAAEPHRLFQMLIGIAVWIVMLGRIDIAQAVILLSPFSAAPQEGHLERAYRIFGYLKWRRHLAIWLDARAPLIDHGSLHSGGEPDFTSFYPDAAEDIDPKLPPAFGLEL